MTVHKGNVLNLQDFPGRVEIVDSEFSRNGHYIPEIKYKFRDES